MAIRFFHQLRQTYADWSKHDAGLLAAAVAYYISWSLFPLLLVLISTFGFVLKFTDAGRDAETAIMEVVADQTSPAIAQQIQGLLADVEARALISGPVGLLVLLLTAIIIFVQLETALDRIWGVEPPERGLVGMILAVVFGRLRAFLLLLVVGIALLAVFIAGLVLSSLVRNAQGVLPIPMLVGQLIQVPIVVLANTGLLTAIFMVLSKIPLRWTEAARGALLAAVVWEVGRQVLALLIVGERYTAYGVIGSFMAVMLWIYYAMAVLLLGAEYVQVIHHQARDEQAARSAS
jgi:membrane protein